jgi:transcriptional regulator with XRE-family HTH domain
MLGQNIRTARKWRGKSVAKLANSLGCSEDYIRKLENGSIKDPSISRVHAIAVFLGITIDTLVSNDEEGIACVNIGDDENVTSSTEYFSQIERMALEDTKLSTVLSWRVRKAAFGSEI